MTVDRVGAAFVGSPLRLAATAAATVCAVAGGAHHRRTVALTKPLAMGLIAASARADRTPIAAASVGTSMLGDYLMFREEFAADRTESERYLRRGAAAFAGTHVAYLLLLRRRGATITGSAFVPRMIPMLEVGGLMTRFAPRLSPVLGPYGLSLASMSAATAHPTLGAARAKLVVGGLLFMGSDALLMNRRFLIKNPRSRAVAEAGVLLSYFAAQRLLLDGLVATEG